MCVSDTTINIQIDPVPSAPLATASNPYCEGSDIENVVASAQGLVNWYADSLMTTLLDTGVVPDNLGKIFNAMNIYVTQVVGACESDPAAVSLTVIPTPQVNFEANPEEQQVNVPVEFINNTDTAGMDTLMFTWNFGDGATSSEQQPQHAYAAVGEYTVSLKAENSQGCYTVDSLTVIIKEDFVFIVPNIFTPNGDGNNDEFKILLQGVQTIHLEIYNRWGRKVYETNDINATWDGGKQKDGVYFWIATGTTTQGDTFEERGNVTLSGSRQ
jgi:gliding motility-associated-like protein